MSRRRYISTDLSTDPRVAELAEQGALPVLLYTWAIAHADDWGRMTGDARQFKLLVCPGFDVAAREVDAALTQIAEVGLWLRYVVEGRCYLAFPPAAWFRYQTYIGRDKRTCDGSVIPAPSDPAYRLTLHAPAQDVTADVPTEPLRSVAGSAQQRAMPRFTEDHRTTPHNAEERRRSPLHARTPSPSLSPSPSPSPIPTSEHDRFSEREGVRTRERVEEIAAIEVVAAGAALALVAPAPVVSPAVSALTSASASASGKKPATARVPDPVWDACIAAMGQNGLAPSNRVERGKWAKGIQALKESLAADGSPPSEIRVRALRYRARFGPSVPLHPMALAGNWTTLATDIQPAQKTFGTQEGQRYGTAGNRTQQQRTGSGYGSAGRRAGAHGGRPAIGTAAYYAQAAAAQAAGSVSGGASSQGSDAVPLAAAIGEW